jgi:uncharacterized membrane protein
MMQRLFWIACTGLCALALHLAYVLFMPGLEMGQLIQRFVAAKGSNDLALLLPEEARGFFKADYPEMVTAACAFDATGGPVIIQAVIPDSYWTISIYSAGGELLFTLDDRQAGLERMRFIVKQPGEEMGLLPDGEVITVETPHASGLVLLQARAQEKSQVPKLQQALAASSCGPRLQ